MKIINFSHLLILLLLISNSAHAKPWVEWDAPEVKNRIERSIAKANYLSLIRFYESQMRKTYCGIATSVVALNALDVEPPQSKFFGKYRIFTQEEFMSDWVSPFIPAETVTKRGMTLSELSIVLRNLKVHVFPYEAPFFNHVDIKKKLIAALKNPKQIVIVAYTRTKVGQEGDGHFSPIAAYDAESDTFLVLDVARFKYPPFWVDASTLINAMDDGRGFMILEKAPALESYSRHPGFKR